MLKVISYFLADRITNGRAYGTWYHGTIWYAYVSYVCT